MQPAAAARYSPRFASPCAAATPAASRKNSPATAGPFASNRLLLLAEIVVAAAAGFADGADLRLHRALIAALAHLVELVRLVLQTARRFLELVLLLPDRGQRVALHVLGRRIERIPRHARQVVEERGIALDDVRVVRRFTLRHRRERPEVLALQSHHRLPLLHHELGLHLRERGTGPGAERHGQQYCKSAASHYLLLGGWDIPKANTERCRVFR